MPTSNFQPIRLLDPDCCYRFAYLMANSADPDQKPTDLDLHCLQNRVFVCVEILRPSQPNGVMSSAVSLPNHTFTGQA